MDQQFSVGKQGKVESVGNMMDGLWAHGKEQDGLTGIGKDTPVNFPN